MARRSKADEYMDLKSRVEAAEQIQKSELHEEWRLRLENWRGQAWQDDGLDGHRVVVNMHWAITNLMTSALYFRDPHVNVEAKRPAVPIDPRVTEKMFNYYIRELHLGRQFKRAIQNALLFDAGYLKLGYEIETELDLEPVTDDAGNELVRPDTGAPLLKNSDGDVYMEKDGKFIQLMEKDGDLVPAEQEKPTLNEFIRKEQPYAVCWPTIDVLRDPEARNVDLSDSRWVAFRSIVPLEEVKNNPLYTGTQNLEGTRQVRDELLRSIDGPSLLNDTDPDADRVELIEVWHKKYNRSKRRYDIWQSVIAKGHDKFLLHRKSPYLIDGFPIEVLSFGEDPESPYGFSPLRAIDSQIETMNISRAQQMEMADQQIQKTIYNKSVISPEDAEKIASSPQGAVVGIEPLNPDADLSRAWVPIPIPQISPDIYLNYDRARDEVQIIFGINEYMMGGAAGPTRQATEAGLIQQGFAVRVEEKRQAVASMVENVVEFFAGLLRQFGDYDKQLKITNELGEEQWIQFKVADAVTDELDYRIDAFESMFQSREVKVKKAQDRLNLLAGTGVTSIHKLVEDVLRADGIQDTTPYFSAQQPMAPPQGPSGDGPASLTRSGAAMDVEQLRRPPNVGAGNEGRALS